MRPVNLNEGEYMGLNLSAIVKRWNNGNGGCKNGWVVCAPDGTPIQRCQTKTVANRIAETLEREWKKDAAEDGEKAAGWDASR